MSPTFSSTNGFILLLTLSGKPSSYIQSYRIPLVHAISKKYRVVNAYTSRDALTHLSTFGLAGVIVADGGIAKGGAGAQVLSKLVQYVGSGGIVVVGLAFSTFVTENEFRAFFRAFDLTWKRGSYHRQDFYLNIPNAIGGNHLLDASYNMKALQVEGITESMAIYQSTGPCDSPAQSSTAPVRPGRSQSNQAPIVVTSVGTGRLGYIGDVNYEKESMNVYLAMLNILGTATCIDTSAPDHPEQPMTVSFADSFPHFTRPARLAPGSRTTATASAGLSRGPHSRHSTRPVPVPRPEDLTIVVVALDFQTTVVEDYKHQLNALGSKLKVVVVSRGSDILQSLASETTVGVYLADGGILRWESTALYPILVEFARTGGKVVCGGRFPATLTPRTATTFFKAFGLSWAVGGTHIGHNELCPGSELAGRNPALLPKRFKMKSRNITDITIHPAVYVPLVPHDLLGSEDEEPLDAPILQVTIGKGSLGYIGDLQGEPETTTVLLAMFDLLRPGAVVTPLPKRQSKKFAILVSPPNLSPLEVECEHGYLIEKVEEKVELVRGLSAERVADLIGSPDLTAVIVSSGCITEPSPAMAYLNSKLVDFTSLESGGTLVFSESFARDVGLQASRDFFLNNWGLDWTAGIRKRVEKEVSLNQTNGLVNGRRKKWLPMAPQWEGALTLTSTRSDDMVYVPTTRREGEGTPGLGQFDGERGMYYEGPVLYAAVGEGGKGKVGFVGGRKDEEETAKVVVTMIVSGF